ncbi:MAG: hypothetical protein ABSE73_27195, partial [Planctomycetota bacterium]
MNPKLFCATLFLALAGLSCRADTVYLSDGTEASGTIVEEDANTIVLKRSNGAVQSYRRKDVDAVVYDRKAPGEPAADAPLVAPKLKTKKAKAAETDETAAPKEGEAKAKTKKAKVAEKDETGAPKEGEAK